MTFANANERVMFFDPSTHSKGNQAALVDRDAFLKLLEREGLEAIWIIAGEKSAYGGRGHHSGWGGSRAHTYLYRMKNGGFVVDKFLSTDLPTKSQLEEFSEG